MVLTKHQLEWIKYPGINCLPTGSCGDPSLVLVLTSGGCTIRTGCQFIPWQHRDTEDKQPCTHSHLRSFRKTNNLTVMLLPCGTKWEFWMWSSFLFLESVWYLLLITLVFVEQVGFSEIYTLSLKRDWKESHCIKVPVQRTVKKFWTVTKFCNATYTPCHSEDIVYQNWVFQKIWWSVGMQRAWQ